LHWAASGFGFQALFQTVPVISFETFSFILEHLICSFFKAKQPDPYYYYYVGS
jgi:hypothetical protein